MLFITLLIFVGRFCWGRISYLICIFFNWNMFVVQCDLKANGVFLLLFVLYFFVFKRKCFS